MDLISDQPIFKFYNSTDTFEEKLKVLAVISDGEKERVPEQVLYIYKDYCGRCLTNQGTGETTLAFCSLGKVRL